MEKNRIPIILATTLSAILLWVSVNMSYEHQIVLSVPLTVENIPGGKAIAGPLPKVVLLKLRGNGWRCAALVLSANPRCILDMSAIPRTKKGLALPDIIDRIMIPTGMLAVDMKRESVFVGLDVFAKKRVAVTFNEEPSFRAGYGQVGQTVISTESVTIGGAASLVQDISRWPCAHTLLNDIKTSIDMDVPLVDSASHYLIISPPEVHMKIDVQQFAEKTIAGLPVESQDVPINKEVILIPPKIDVIVRGGVDQLGALGVDSFHASIDYRVLVADSTGYTNPSILTPKGVQLVNTKPTRMQFIIRTRL